MNFFFIINYLLNKINYHKTFIRKIFKIYYLKKYLI